MCGIRHEATTGFELLSSFHTLNPDSIHDARKNCVLLGLGSVFLPFAGHSVLVAGQFGGDVGPYCTGYKRPWDFLVSVVKARSSSHT